MPAATFKVRAFQDTRDLEAFLNSDVSDPSKVVQIYYDASSGKHVVVYRS